MMVYSEHNVIAPVAANNSNIVKKKSPKVSIGMPAYNGELSIRDALEALLNQTFTDFELIISDNASTDGTELICQEYAAKDVRIQYIRQQINLGAALNFKFVMDKAVGEYFMWAAADDQWSADFIESNAAILDRNPTCVASTSPNCYAGELKEISRHVTFALEGNRALRISAFLRYAWISHGIFYSLMSTKVIKGCDQVGQSYAAMDWSVDIYLANQGVVHRSKEGWLILGRGGASHQGDIWRRSRNMPIEVIFPLYKFSQYTLRLMKSLSILEWLQVSLSLLKVNIQAMRSNFTMEVRQFLKGK